MKRLQILQASKLLSLMDDVVIVFHKNPDGDALGSALALHLGLRQLNKRCRILSFLKVPERFDFLFKGLNFEKFDQKNVVAVDLASGSLIERELENIKIDLVIDHHLNNDVDADFGLIDNKSAATCELIYDLLKQLGVKFDKLIALSLYVGLVTDTGCFKFSNTTEKTHRIAADLLGYGIDFSDVNFRLFDFRTIAQVALQNVAFERLRFFFDGCCVVVFITRELLEKCNCFDSDFFVVVDLIRCIKGVKIAVAGREIFDNCYKISVRTVAGFSAARFCKCFGGGGHERAAGFEISGCLGKIEARIIEVMESLF